MMITLNLNDQTANLLKDILEEEIEGGSRISGPDSSAARALLSDLHSASHIPANGSQPTLLQPYASPLFGNGAVAEDSHIISRYSREDALSDGALVDVTAMAREVGYDLPVALTRELAADVAAIPENRAGSQDETGRMWDLLSVGFLHMRRLIAKNKQLQAENQPLQMETIYAMGMPVGETEVYRVKLIFTVEENHDKPVITLRKPDQD